MIRTNILTAVLLATSFTAFSSIASAAGPDTFMNGQSFYGQPASGVAAARTVDLATTNHANVNYGETVNFVSGSKTFAWTFNGLDRRAVDVAKIAPPNFATKPFTVYVARNPFNRN